MYTMYSRFTMFGIGVTRISTQESLLFNMAIIGNSLQWFMNFTVIILGMQIDIPFRVHIKDLIYFGSVICLS
jgi:hypothetical protein